MVAHHATRFFCMRDGVYNTGNWSLGDVTADGEPFNNWALAGWPGEVVPAGVLETRVVQHGPVTDVNFAGYGGVLVVSDKMRDLLEEADADVAFREIRVAGAAVNGRSFWVLDVLQSLDCVDEEASELEFFEENDPVRPDRAGHIRSMFRLVLDPARTEGHPIFRLKRNTGTIIVTGTLRECMQAEGINGMDWGDANGGSFYASA